VDRLLLAAVIVVIASGAAQALRRRGRVDAPTQPRGALPSQLDRSDFDHADVPWLVAVFTSDACSTCADVVTKARVVSSGEVEVVVASFQERRDLHERYAIDAVPCLVVAGPDGAVHAGFLGPVTATDLWAAVAEAREPGSVREPGGGCARHADDSE
jgi:hypothetical protein